MTASTAPAPVGAAPGAGGRTRPHGGAHGRGNDNPVAARVPLFAGEIGEDARGHACVDRAVKWRDDRGLSCPGRTRSTGDRGSGPALIGAYDGTSAAFGAGPRDRPRALTP